ncbi:MAG: hypothetical protein ACXWPK_07065 [Isosphaeraceae bacterium]
MAGSLPGDLASGQDIWPVLPEAIRAGVVAMVKAASRERQENERTQAADLQTPSALTIKSFF